MGNSSTHPTQLSFTIISNKHVAELLLEKAEKKEKVVKPKKVKSASTATVEDVETKV